MEIYRYGAKVLRGSSQQVEKISDELLELMDAMMETMILAPGIGLAAPQVGRDLRLFVMNVQENEFQKVLNPRILKTSGVTTFNEGCLSFPQLFADVVRPEWVRVEYLNEEGEIVVEEHDGLWARCFLHEVDHLEGKLFIDYLSHKQLKLLKEALGEIESAGLRQNSS
jgi:peptide deformylase